MDTRDGRIYDHDQVAALSEANRAFVREMKLDPNPAQLAAGKVGRNDPCPCGSGRKFKVCCLRGDPVPTEAAWPPRSISDLGLPHRPAIGPTEVMAAVRAMDAAPLRELGELLGIEVRPPTLCLPGASGGFVEPITLPPGRA